MMRSLRAQSTSNAGFSWATTLLTGCLTLGCLTLGSLTLGSLTLGCGRTDSAPPVSDQEMEDLDLDFDMGLEAPIDSPKDADHSPSEIP